MLFRSRPPSECRRQKWFVDRYKLHPRSVHRAVVLRRVDSVRDEKGISWIVMSRKSTEYASKLKRNSEWFIRLERPTKRAAMDKFIVETYLLGYSYRDIKRITGIKDWRAIRYALVVNGEKPRTNSEARLLQEQRIDKCLS